MSDQPDTVFRFTAEGVDLEFAGSEEFVEKQVQRFRAFLEQAIGQSGGDGGGEVATAVATASGEPSPQSLDDFYATRPTREGRGAIQDRILLFLYYLEEVQGRNAASKEDISWCFQQVGLGIPKNLLNALGNMKRKLGFLQAGARRGLYQLSPKGRKYVEERFQPA
jgi:hypothetical protein